MPGRAATASFEKEASAALLELAGILLEPTLADSYCPACPRLPWGPVGHRSYLSSNVAGADSWDALDHRRCSIGVDVDYHHNHKLFQTVNEDNFH